MTTPSPLTTTIAPWVSGQPQSSQAWNADLNNIAAQYGITLQQLEQANPQISNYNSIPAGTVINIPASQSSTGSSTTGSVSPSSGTGGTTSTVPGFTSGPQQYDTSQANTGTGNGNVATGTGAAQAQAQQSQAMSQLQSFFGSGSGYAPQYLTGQQQSAGPAQQATTGSASGTKATSASQQAASGSAT